MTVNPNYPEINVEHQENDPNSLLNLYRKAIALRKSLPVVRYGSYKEYRKLSGKRCIYGRDDSKQKLLVVCSFSEKATAFRAPKKFNLTQAKLILCNYNNPKENILQSYEARVYLWD